ncbi:AraC family transcriptional regulator [Nocardioides sp. Bht2]|uniref:AraC family transcriptional regulator n=1 Tax=Nocardioides sp. Bht2 TaxID=3392297 RepID=UPI0039B6CDE0
MAELVSFSTDVVVKAVSVVVNDPGTAENLGSRYFYPQQLDVLGADRSFGMSLEYASLPELFLADLTYDQAVSINCGELETSYHVNVPLSGVLTSSHAGRESVVAPGRATIYGPQGETVLSRWEAGCRQLCVKLGRSVVEQTLVTLIGRDGGDVLEFDPILDVRSGPGRSWVEFALFLNSQVRLGGSPMASPMVAVPMVEALARALLTSAGHKHRPQLELPVPTASSRAVRVAIDFLEERAADPITINDLATHCCVSVRTIQEAFARHVGIPPLQYLREIRLKRAHADLQASDPARITVATIAHRWGFAHLGRFAAAHTKEFGEPPSVTLRGGA